MSKNWRTVPLRAVTIEAQTGPFGTQLHADEYVENGVPVINPSNIKDGRLDPNMFVTVSETTACRLASHRLATGDLLFARRGELGRAAVVPQHASGWLCGTGSLRVRVRQSVLKPRFARYVIQDVATQRYFEQQAVGSTMENLNTAIVLKLPIPLPDPEEQCRIADFLDAETARIDRIASARKLQQADLDELELALIRDMLSGSVSREIGKSTGFPWLPAIPEEWPLGPVYAYFTTELGKMLNAERAAGGNQQVYLRNANIHWYSVDVVDMATMSFDADERRRYSVAPGDLMVCEGGAGVAEAAVWDGRIGNCYFQKSLHRVRRAGSVPVEWLMYWLRLAKHVGVFEADGNVATIPHLTGEQLRRCRIPIPPDGDKRVSRLSVDMGQIVSARSRLDDALAVLAERRQALITAAVTGQIDVTSAQ